MVKKSKKSKKNETFKKPVVFIPLAVVILLLVCYLGRGWIRVTAVPAAVQLTYGRQVQNTLNKDYNSLKPFDTLGMANVKSTDKCRLLYAKNFKIMVDCTSSYSSFSDKLSPGLGARAKNLGNSLKNSGWQSGITTIETLGQNIGQGIDWTPDAAYMKQAGKTFCLADFNTAFSKPKPPALNGSVSCSRLVEIF